MAAVDQRTGGSNAAAVRFELTARQSLGQIPARIVLFGALLVIVRFVLGAGSVLSGQQPLLAGWFLAVLGAYCLSVALWVVVTGRARAVLEPRGVWREGLRDSAFVPWSDVVAVKQVRLLDARWVSLRRTDGRRIWLPAPATSVTGPDPDFGQKIDTVRDWWKRYGQLPSRVSRGDRWRRRLPACLVLLFCVGWLVVQVLRYDIRPGREEVRALPDACTVLEGVSASRDVAGIPPEHGREDEGSQEIERCEWDRRRAANGGAGIEVGRLDVELRRYERVGPDSGPRRATEDVKTNGGRRLGGEEFAVLADLADEAVVQIDSNGEARQVLLHVRRVNVVLDVTVTSERRTDRQLTGAAVDVARTVLSWVEVG